jgi:hypothetical protein
MTSKDKLKKTVTILQDSARNTGTIPIEMIK